MPKGHNNLVFEDNFSSLDRQVWQLRGHDLWSDGMTHADADYAACRISGRALRMNIVPDPDNPPGDVLTGHIGTMSSFQFYQGYVEAKMKFYPYHGMHGSLWLQSEGPYQRGRPEIDVVEYFGAHNPERKAGINVYHNVYYRDEEGPILNKKIVTNSVTFGANWYKEWHLYGLLWNDLGYHFFIDRKKVGTISGIIDTSPKYIVLSNLVRDYEWPYLAEHPIETYKTSVDWVRVWQ